MRRFTALIFLSLIFAVSPAGAQKTSTSPVVQSPGQSLAPGSIFKECKNCPQMVVVPAGIYIMGLGGKGRHGPPHRVNFKRPLAVGRYEVKFSEWFACVRDEVCIHQPHDHKWGRIGRPVINITWHQAKNFTKWLSKKTGFVYRLPTEAEWEYAHRGGTTTKFWWGDKPGENLANCRDCKSRACCTSKDHSCCSHGTQPVGTYGANPFGLHDTSGNVFEWTEDCWNRGHKGAPRDGSARKSGDCRNRVIRGGSFYYFNKVSQSYYRSKNPPGVKSYWLGFRVVREMP